MIFPWGKINGFKVHRNTELRITVPKGQEVTGQRGKLHNE